MKLSKYNAGRTSVNTAELKVKEGYKKYKDLYLGDISKVEKDYIKALEYMEIKLLGDWDKI